MRFILDKFSRRARHSYKSMPALLQIERLYDTHAQALFGFLFNLTRSEEDTRDILQEVFVKLTRNPQLFNGVRQERPFLLRLAHNLSIDQVRRRTTRQKNYEQLAVESVPLFASSDDPDERAFRDALAGALDELPAEQRAVVHLKLWEGQTFEEIAATLDLSPNTAASRYRYGLDKIRERLRPLYEEIK